MTQVKDPVCGMLIDSETAAGKTEYSGSTYYFCSSQCVQQFESDPARYVGATASSTHASDQEVLESHEPPYTKSGGIVSPKFGAAGSGGAEYERLPETHDDRASKDH